MDEHTSQYAADALPFLPQASVGRRVSLILAALALLAVLPYLRSLSLPFISDDYVQIGLARTFVPPSGWRMLAADVLYRCRTTSLVMTYWTDAWFGLTPLAFNLSSLLVHILNTWLVFALGMWRPVGWRIAALAAAFFAVYEGHQEAVIWYAALPELLVFFFALLAFLFWVRWIQSPAGGAGNWLVALACFVLALASKESAVAVVPLLLLPVSSEKAPWRRWLAPWSAFAVLAGLYMALIFAGSAHHLHFHDAGTFSLHAPVALVWTNSFGRMFWIWGWIAVLVLVLRRRQVPLQPVLLAFAWAGITLLPYAFLTYMNRVPSRHTYFASAGMAWIVALGAVALYEGVRLSRRSAVWALAGVVVAHNCLYIWTKKQQQFLERAAPTEKLVRFARKARGPIYVHCFPYGLECAERAVALRVGKTVAPMPAPGGQDSPIPAGSVFCLSPREHLRARGPLPLSRGVIMKK